MLNFNWDILWIILNLVILYFLLKKFLFKPIMKIMADRENLISDSISSSENKVKEADLLKNKYEQILQNAENDASNIIKKGEEEAKSVYDSIIKSAREDAAHIMEEAKKSIEFDRQKALKSAYDDIASLALMAANRIVQKNIDESDSKKIVEEFLSEAGVA